WAKGGEGGKDLAEKVKKAIENNTTPFDYFYSDDLTIKEKIEKVCTEIYGADGVVFDKKTKKVFDTIAAEGLNHLPICMSKTQKSISDNPALLGRPTGFTVKIDELKLAVGAGFVIVMAGGIIDMPGLPKKPAAEVIDIDENGVISGLF
ncbi:MAG: formate--tetrahydrofolate ligase, partial [Fusobacterium sp.]|nr:formate--tetrahydrofolate ligase [Fusobacterium sp.]